MKADPFQGLLVLAETYFPGQEATEEVLGKTLYLETRYWERMEACITNGIVKAFKS